MREDIKERKRKKKVTKKKEKERKNSPLANNIHTRLNSFKLSYYYAYLNTQRLL